MAKKVDKEEFENTIRSIYGDRYTLVSENFNGMSTIITIRCNICNHEYTLMAKEFTRNREKNRNRFIDGCDHCRLIRKTEEIKERIRSISNGKISVDTDELISSTHKIIDLRCNICNHKFKGCLHTLESHSKTNKSNDSFGCAVCSGKLKKNTEIFKQEVYNLVKDEYEVLGEYVNTNEYIRIKHCKCNTIYEVRPNDFLNHDNRCPECCDCLISNASKFIDSYLKENNIEYEKEKKFEDCKFRYVLPFDFYISEYNLIIEYDGEQHFKASFGEDNCTLQHKRDIIKNTYCKNSNINLIRIKYTLPISKIKELLSKLLNDNLTNNDYKEYNLYVIDVEDDVIYNEKTYYKEFN